MMSLDWRDDAWEQYCEEGQAEYYRQLEQSHQDAVASSINETARSLARIHGISVAEAHRMIEDAANVSFPQISANQTTSERVNWKTEGF